jgi:hypothetical protein
MERTLVAREVAKAYSLQLGKADAATVEECDNQRITLLYEVVGPALRADIFE